MIKYNSVLIGEFTELKTLNSYDSQFGIVDITTKILVSDGQNIINDTQQKTVFKGEFKLIDQGIGGLSKEFEEMFRRVFATRVLDAQKIEEMDIKHIKGIVLYGPPGCGKTLIARQIGNMLNCKEFKVVNGPELLNKYVGESEANTRNLFSSSIKDKSENLYLIVLDEMDALCKTRNSSQGDLGVSAGVVNTLLSHIDGVNQLNNILLIGMTNRLDMIDSALLRPGRFEVAIEIGLPDDKRRYEILNIHTAKMNKNRYINDSVNLSKIAEMTRNFTSAEIEGVVKSARSFAISRTIDTSRMSSNEKPILTMDDFVKGVKDIKPMFGEVSDEISKYCKHPLVMWSHFDHIFTNIVEKSQELTDGHTMKILIHGKSYSGKTTLACNVVNKINASCARMITPSMLSVTNVTYNCDLVRKIFNEISKTSTGIVIIDSFERLIEWCPIGMRINNQVLQTLLVEMNCHNTNATKLIIIITCDNKQLIDNLEMNDLFDNIYEIPSYIHREDAKLFNLGCDQEYDVSYAIKHYEV